MLFSSLPVILIVFVFLLPGGQSCCQSCGICQSGRVKR